MKNVFAFVLSCVSAYALSFSADLLFGMLLGVYPRNALLPVVTWCFIALVTGVAAFGLASRKRFLAIPFAVITAAAIFGGIIGRRYDFAVAAVMALASGLVWLGTRATPVKSAPNR